MRGVHRQQRQRRRGYQRRHARVAVVRNRHVDDAGRSGQIEGVGRQCQRVNRFGEHRSNGRCGRDTLRPGRWRDLRDFDGICGVNRRIAIERHLAWRERAIVDADFVNLSAEPFRWVVTNHQRLSARRRNQRAARRAHLIEGAVHVEPDYRSVPRHRQMGPHVPRNAHVTHEGVHGG